MMNPHVLCHRLRFPRDFSPSKISGPGTSKAGMTKKLFGQLKCGKSTVAFVCHNCHKIFTYLLAMQNHVRHQCASRGPVLQCQFCDKLYTSTHLREYVLHRDLKHSMQCSQCPKSFVTQRALVLHRSSQHREIIFYYKCDLCRKGFKTRSKLKEHYKEHRSQEAAGERNLKQHRCSYCRQICFGFKGLATHYRKHQADIRSHEEEMKRLSAYDEARTERKEERKVKKAEKSIQNGGTLSIGDGSLFVCYDCNIYFRKACELMNHMKNHVDGSTVCKKCLFKMSTSKKLEEHKKKIHFYKCKTCYLTFVKNSHRKNHKTSCKGVESGFKV